MGVTIREVAHEAGVSVATVSRVFNGSGPVKAGTRDRILGIARALRYVPNGSARSLTTSETGTVGVLLPDLYGEFFSELIRGMDQAVRESRRHLLVSSAHDGAEELEAALRTMSGRVDGLVVMSPDLDAEVLEANLPAGLPVVLVNCALESAVFDTITIDNYGGAYAMVRHLIDHGHRRVALLRGAAGNHDAAERLRGYRDALTAEGIAPDPALEFEGEFTERSGYVAAQRMLALPSRPTAVFAANDSMAIGALRALREVGMQVPAEMAVAGFDDVPVAHYVSPTLSSVHVPIHEMGTRSVEFVLRALEAGPGHEPGSLILPTRLVLRESCGHVSAARPSTS
jgi:LacI family transcriptional regulator